VIGDGHQLERGLFNRHYNILHSLGADGIIPIRTEAKGTNLSDDEQSQAVRAVVRLLVADGLVVIN
jgi:dihydrodipicolinate synthase/N-acetylneuraminate lyase